MDSQMDGPPLRRTRLFLVTEQFVICAADVVASEAVTDGPASGPVDMVLDDKLPSIAVLLAAARHVTLHTDVYISS